LLLSALGFFFSRLPLDICLSFCADSQPADGPYAFHRVPVRAWRLRSIGRHTGPKG
jgi:hypothetical protein